MSHTVPINMAHLFVSTYIISLVLALRCLGSPLSLPSTPTINPQNEKSANLTADGEVLNEIGCWTHKQLPGQHPITFQTCQSMFAMMDHDIQAHPEEQYWGGEAAHHRTWFDPLYDCQIEVEVLEETNRGPVRFSYAFAKSVAIMTMDKCSQPEYGEGRGGYLHVSPKVMIIISWPWDIDAGKTLLGGNATS